MARKPESPSLSNLLEDARQAESVPPAEFEGGVSIEVGFRQMRIANLFEIEAARQAQRTRRIR
jgi:hypothetical protein